MKKLFLLILTLLLMSCSPVNSDAVETSVPSTPKSTLPIIPSATHQSVVVTATPRPFATWTSDGKTTTETDGLVIMLWELAAPPELEPLKFITKDRMTHTAQEMGKGEFLEYNRMDPLSMWTMMGDKKLVASENYGQNGQGWVTVSQNGQEIYHIETGGGSPISALRQISTYDNHWVLETNNHIKDTLIHGQIIQDGVLLNEKYDYEEAFLFQTIGKKPFYLFKRNGKIDIWFDGKEIPLGLNQVSHYGCCSAGELNPRQWTSMLAFFGVRNKTWYFVQIGTPDSFR